MKIPNIKEMESQTEVRYTAMLELQTELNAHLKKHFEASRAQGRKYLASTVITEVESMIDELNKHNYNLGRYDYGGDINYEQSEQRYSNGKEMGDGLIIRFLGFSAQVSWQNA